MLRVACIGAGYWGKNLIRNFYEIGALHSICDGNESVLGAFSRDYPDVNCCQSVEQVLSSDQIDAVCIATPAETHYELIVAALNAGKHVYAEKPLCLDEGHARVCIELAESKGLLLMVGHLLWYHPMVLEIKRAVDAGELGELRYVYSNRLNTGLLRTEEDVLWSFAPHDISMILGIVGEEPSNLKVNASSHITSGISDHVIASMDFESGVSAHIFVSWFSPVKEQKLVVIGDAAMFLFDDTLEWERKLARYSHSVEWEGERPTAIKGQPEYIKLSKAEPLKNECLHFIESIESGGVPRTDGKEGLRVLNVLNKLKRAMNP